MTSTDRSKLTIGLIVVLGLLIGAAFALIVTDGSPPVTGQTDVCHGNGDLISTGSWEITDEAVDVVERVGLGIALQAGETRELRTCQVGEFDTVTMDAQSGVIIHKFTDYGAMIEQATEQPWGTPEAYKAFERAQQDAFVEPSAVPTDLTAGCDPGWVETTLEQVGAVMCHPADWVVKSDSAAEGLVAGGAVEVGVLGLQTESHITKCLAPRSVDTAAGTAAVCAFGPNVFVRVNYGIALPNGRNLGINVFKEASVEEELLALRVAMNVRSTQ